ncbi:hypothetical protein [Sporosarcina sp. Marseille-Q4063]|nr:hypothetical protein [Sporosarcina sp. Marseille-Q4063]
MFSCHIQIDEETDEQVVLQQAINLKRDNYKIERTTIQIEKSNL